MVDKWTYEDSSNWGLAAENEKQSPINIDTGIAASCHELCELKFLYKKTQEGEPKIKVQFNKNQNLALSNNSGSNIIYKNTPYKLTEITLHTPSLHTIDGVKCDLEICLIHSLGDNPHAENGVVVSCLFNEGNYFGNSENFVHQFVNEIKINSRQEVRVSNDWGAHMILPERKSFYLYEGTLHFPPCTPMTNIVMDTIGNVSPINLELLNLNLGKNVRPIQTLDDRRIYYNSGKSLQIPEPVRNVKISQNKYLRCKPDPNYKKVETYNGAGTDKDKDKNNVISSSISKGLEESTKKTIRNMFLILVIFSILAHSFYITKHLFKLEYAQKLIIAIVGVEALNGGTANNVLEVWRNSNQCTP